MKCEKLRLIEDYKMLITPILIVSTTLISIQPETNRRVLEKL